MKSTDHHHAPLTALRLLYPFDANGRDSRLRLAGKQGRKTLCQPKGT